MLEIHADIKTGVKKRIADVNIKQFEADEFNVSCKELILGRPVVTYGNSFSIYDAEYKGTAVAVKVVSVDESDHKAFIDTLVDLTALAVLPHENIAAFYGAGYSFDLNTKKGEVLYASHHFLRLFTVLFYFLRLPIDFSRH